MCVFTICDLVVADCALNKIDMLRLMNVFIQDSDCRVAIDVNGNQILRRYRDVPDPNGLIRTWIVQAAKFGDFVFKKVSTSGIDVTGREIFFEIAKNSGNERFLIAKEASHYDSFQPTKHSVSVLTGQRAHEKIYECCRNSAANLGLNVVVYGENEKIHMGPNMTKSGDTFSNNSDSQISSHSSNVKQTKSALQEKVLQRELTALKSEIEDVLKQAAIEKMQAEMRKSNPDKPMLGKLWEAVKSGLETSQRVLDIGSKLPF